MIRDELVKEVIEVGRVTPRIMKVKMVMGKKVGHIFSVYAPQAGRLETEKEAFWGR
jgi:phage host-nuclease inhibitor protein Gam